VETTRRNATKPEHRNSCGAVTGNDNVTYWSSPVAVSYIGIATIPIEKKTCKVAAYMDLSTL
jgi:hypothetical protein